MARGENLTPELRRKAVAVLVAQGRAHRYTSAEARAAGRKGGKASAKTRRARSMQRVVDTILNVFEARVAWLSDRERARVAALMAMAWRKGYKVGHMTARKGRRVGRQQEAA